MNGQRVGRAQLQVVRERLSDRDLALLQSLAEHRLLTTGQLQRLHFAGHATDLAGIRACVRVLDRLHRERLITRLDRRIGGLHAGSRAFVWCLDAVGERVVRNGEEKTRRRVFEPTILFLEHTLAVAEVRVEAEEAARAGLFELLDFETEPACWREYVGPHGQPAILKPDLALVTATGDFEDYWLVEVDRGTESIRTLIGKSAQYEAYRRAGREQAEHGVFPLVVWSVPNSVRRDRLLEAIRETRDLDPALYCVVAPGDVIPLLTGTAPLTEAASTPPDTSTLERRNP